MRVAVIGAANIDIIVKSKSAIVQGESNPADVSLKAGGVARNIAAMLALRGVDVDLIAAIGKDPFGKMLMESCKDIGVNTDAWIIKSNASTGVYLATKENDGELHTGFTAITAPESIRTAEITKHKKLIFDADLLVMDLNLSEKIINVALELRDHRPVMVDAVSVDRIPRIEKFLNRIDILKLNRLEAEKLTGITLDTKERVKQACNNIVSRGVTRVFITMGMAGVCAADYKNAIFVPAVPVVVKDFTGAGDAFSTGIILQFEKDLRTQAESGITLAGDHLTRKM
ncbi:MAG: PfkB family carbohydrate kinase [Oscillospiraceae bacterium]|nr:PfkB family carbohydrate kinase [Oscillospiraceae bacterium]